MLNKLKSLIGYSKNVKSIWEYKNPPQVNMSPWKFDVAVMQMKIDHKYNTFCTWWLKTFSWSQNVNRFQNWSFKFFIFLYQCSVYPWNQCPNFVTIFCHMAHNSEWKCAVFWKIVKIILYPFHILFRITFHHQN